MITKKSWMIALFLCGWSCASAPKTVPLAPIASYVGEQAKLFDDAAEDDVILGKESEEKNDSFLKQRVLMAEGIVRSKVIGVTSEPFGEDVRFALELQPEGEPLSGSPPGSLILRIPPKTPLSNWAKARENKLIGQRYIVIYKRYELEDSTQSVTHFHLMLATEKIESTIKTIVKEKTSQ